MTTLTVFEMVSIDGYIADAAGDMSWAHKSDPEQDAFTSDNAKGGGVLLFGRKTYDMMASFWPTPMAAERLPVVAESMNSRPKIVFSRTLEKATWKGTTVIKGDPVAEVRRMKSEGGPNMALMGSASIASQLVPHGLVDELQLLVNPIILGGGKSPFAGIAAKVAFRLLRTRTFANGNVFLCYGPG